MTRSDLLLLVSFVSEVLLFLVAVRLLKRDPWRLVGAFLLVYAWISISQEILQLAVKCHVRGLVPFSEMAIGSVGRLLQGGALLMTILAALVQVVTRRGAVERVVPPDLPVGR